MRGKKQGRMVGWEEGRIGGRDNERKKASKGVRLDGRKGE